MYSDSRELECMSSPDLGPTFPLSGKASVQSLFGVYFTYVNKFIDYHKVRLSRGLLTELPLDSLLSTVWEATPLTLYEGLEKQITNEIRKKFIRALRLILSYTSGSKIESDLSNLIELEIKAKTDRGNQRSASSDDLRWVT